MTDEGKPTPVGKKTSPLTAAGIAIGGMLGVTMGTLFVAPRVMANRAPAAVEQRAEPVGAPRSGGFGSGGERSGEFVELGNILVNPAGSRGLRFLMATITLEVLGGGSDGVQHLRRRDAQLRDLIIGVLEAYTLEDLTGVGARDSAKHDIAAAVDSVFGIPVEIFMPQFVIN